MTETDKMEILCCFMLKAIITIARHIKPLSPDIAEVINEGITLLNEAEK